VFWSHRGWPDDNDIIESITSLAVNERGEVLIEVPRLSDFEILVVQDLDEVEYQLYQGEILEAIADLDPGKYLLTRSPSTTQWAFQPDDTIIDMPRVIFETEIDPLELSHCRDLQFVAMDDLIVEDLGHGLGVATIRGSKGEKMFLKSTGRKPKEFFIKEVSALHRLSHPNIVGFKACVLNDNQQIVGFLTEFAERGDLHQHLDVSPLLKKEWTLQVVDALQYTRREGVEYEDIKCGNIVIIGGAAKLVDFDGGFSMGHFKEGFESFSIAVLLETLGVPNVDELVEDAKTTSMPLGVFQTRLASISLT